MFTGTLQDGDDEKQIQLIQNILNPQGIIE